jgi:hypothetical protein
MTPKLDELERLAREAKDSGDDLDVEILYSYLHPQDIIALVSMLREAREFVSYLRSDDTCGSERSKKALDWIKRMDAFERGD